MRVIISESQLGSYFKRITETKQISKLQAMRKIVEILKKNGFEDEEIVDFIIQLRLGDEFTKLRSKKFKDEPDFENAVSSISPDSDT